MLSGFDPSFELPLTENELGALRNGGLLSVTLSWPISPNYIVMLGAMREYQLQLESALNSFLIARTTSKISEEALRRVFEALRLKSGTTVDANNEGI